MTNHLVKAVSDDVGLRRETNVDSADLPMWLARLHRTLPVDAAVNISISGDLPVPEDLLLEGAGFRMRGSQAIRQHSLPDIVRPRMRLLICGLNPSLYSADQRVGFARKGNRFWPAAIEAGVVTKDRDTDAALADHRVGFTDLAKRATVRADEVNSAEFEAGRTRLERLMGWLEPNTLVMVGLTGWRMAVDRQAVAGWQDAPMGATQVYLMPNTSGLNTHETLASLTEHLKRAAAGPSA